ncbi:hypothetical protein P5G51_004705 [Virgibacillus sp. 179-BFC.A HS]|uniref:Uncharacterized protein n=1 Tax=Tigheibacillus jepli TaxID=3035914 RepID=A0ABU5CEM9_9BACI|nr:hypothetical protein [Virgibacillus sp. 179-BFC.A HS]MDY0404792.1 hypothetical protein [Virgibacillus sp. 179-BFC.A HS]
MKNLNDRLKLAKMELGKSVIQINPNIIDAVKEKNEQILYFGVKNTDQIPSMIIEKIRSNPNYAWLTIDKASHNGRAIDTDLMNPVTYRAMTGSSSGGPINILKGIIDFAIGTDGGVPSLALQ